MREFIIFFTICLFCLASCKDDEIIIIQNVGKIISLNDTIISPVYVDDDGITLRGEYQLDIDDDLNTDLIFRALYYGLGREALSSIIIELKNNSRIAFQSAFKNWVYENHNIGETTYDTDTINIPRIFSLQTQFHIIINTRVIL